MAERLDVDAIRARHQRWLLGGPGHFRSDVPALIAEVERLRAVLQRLVDLEEEGGPDVLESHWWVMAMESARDVLEGNQ